ncbi:hypothetical protein SH501x_000692 [Pirellulaceae bacterium SH501]
MPIISTCESCGSTLQVDDAFAGLQARCGMCNAIYTVPHQPLADAASESERTLDQSGSVETKSETFWVKVPDGNVYGPTDSATILSWAEQGRVNATCEVNPNGSQLWLNFTVWRMQQLEKHASTSVGVSAAARTPNLFGDQFGVHPVPANQKPTTSSGQGLLILSLGLISWFLCPTILGAPLCSIITLILATNELRKISEGRSPRGDRTLVLIGMWLAIGNMALSAFFVLLFFIGLMS